MTPQPLRILIVAEDRRMLRHLSKSLGAFGYTVQQVADWQLALAVFDVDPPQLLLVDSQPDARAALEFCGSADRRVRPAYVHTFLMVRQPTPRELTEALEAGVDDFLEKPIVYGELLTRLRSAARVLEFERRLRQQSGADPLTHLPSRTLFSDRLRGVLSPSNAQSEPAACVLIDLDFFGRINHLHGRPAGDKVLRDVAEMLIRHCRQTDLAASFGGGRFAVLLGETSESDATTWTERLREALAKLDLPADESPLRLTASFGIVGLQQGFQSEEDVLESAESALHAAKNSGRDCTVRYGEFDGDAEAWADFAAPGKLFDRTLARHVMTPCTIVLDGDSTVAQAAELFRRCRVPALPVVDEDGKLAGLVSEESVLNGPSGVDLASLHLRDLLTTDVPTYEEEAGFTTLRDFLTRDSRSLIVIVNDGAPTGFVTPNDLAALSNPLTADSFAPNAPLTAGSEYLVVPDLCPLDDG